MTVGKRLLPTIVAACLAATLVFVVSCATTETAPEPIERRIMLIGIDGMEWDVMGPLLEDGRLPNFEALMQEGCWGEIRSLDVLESPVIWTSVATGKLPGKHGITGFVKNVSGRHEPTPVTANVRRVKTIWNILGERGLVVGVIAWLATWPAEPVNGYLVTSYFNYERHDLHAGGRAITFPDGLADDLDRLRVTKGDVPDERAATFVTGEVPAKGERRTKFDGLKDFIATDETARAVAFEMARVMPVDFFAVYFRAVDGPSHLYWVDMLPGTGPGTTAEDAALFGEVIPRYYEYMDSVLGELLELADENTTVIVTSDHGHSGPKLRGERYVWGIPMHDPTGVFVIAGKDVVAARELGDVSVLDITPTILALLGLPVAEDMDGKVLTEAIDPSFLRAHPVGTVETYEDAEREGVDEEPIESPVDDEVRERLRSLGYIE